MLGLQTIVSRRTDLMKSPAVVSIATINGGSRGNIIAESVEMTGSIRAYDQGVRKGIHRDIKQIARLGVARASARALFQLRYRAAQSRHQQSRAKPQPRLFRRWSALVVGVRALAMVTVNYLATANGD